MVSKEKLSLDQLQVKAEELGLSEKGFSERMVWLALLNKQMSAEQFKKTIEMVMATHYRVMPGGIILYREN